MRFLVVLVGFLLLSWPVLGHHSNTGIDPESVVEFRGTVTEFRWRNPHIYVIVERTNDRGDAEQWQFETGAIPVLDRSGWTAESLELDGTWQSRGWLGDGFGALKLTDKGILARNEYDPDRDAPTALCIGYPVIQNLATRFYLNQIESDAFANTISIRSEFFDSVRTVQMDERDLAPDGERTLNGYSIGRWADGTLTVETTMFAEHRSPYGSGGGIPSGPDKRVEERYTLSEDGTALFVDVRLEDSEYLAEPFEGRIEWSYVPDLEFHRYECDPDVAAHFRSD